MPTAPATQKEPTLLGQESPTLLADMAPADPEIVEAMKNNWLSNIHYAMIGRVAAAWARFEVTVDLWLIDFADLSTEVGICFTGQFVGPRARMDAFIAMVRHLGADKEWTKQLAKLANEAEAMARQRNRAVHDVWELSDAATPLRVERTAFKTVRALAVHVPTADLQKLELQIIDLDHRFHQMAAQVFSQCHASPGTSP